MIRLIIFLTSIVFISVGLMGCSSGSKKENTDKFEVQTVTVDKNAPKIATLPLGALPNISGLWKSQSAEPTGEGQFATREYNITLSRWEMTYAVAADKDMKKTIYIYHADGSYTLEKEAAKIQGGFQANFRVSRRTLNLKSKDLKWIKEFGLQKCNLIPGKEKDISESGCSFYPSVTKCEQEFDVVRIENGMLRLGERPDDNDICTPEKRPDTLGPFLRKIN